MFELEQKKNLSQLTKNQSTLYPKKRPQKYGLGIWDPRSRIRKKTPIPDTRVRKPPDPDPDPQHCNQKSTRTVLCTV
jgi:hypothetical protein